MSIKGKTSSWPVFLFLKLKLKIVVFFPPTNLLFAAPADEVELQFGTVVVEVVDVLVVVAGVGTQLWLSWLNTSAELFHS